MTINDGCQYTVNLHLIITSKIYSVVDARQMHSTLETLLWLKLKNNSDGALETTSLWKVMRV